MSCSSSLHRGCVSPQQQSRWTRLGPTRFSFSARYGRQKYTSEHQLTFTMSRKKLFGSVAQATFQVLAPSFSEAWFDMKGRTTATMLMSICMFSVSSPTRYSVKNSHHQPLTANPIGGALGQLISPLVSTPKKSVLVLGIISTVATPFVFLIYDAPPTPPCAFVRQYAQFNVILIIF